MNTILIVLLIVVLLVLLGLIGVVVWLALRVSQTNQPGNEQIASLSGKLDAIQLQVDSNLKSMTSQVGVFGEVRETLGKVTMATNRVAELGEDITKLQTILQSGLKRGGFGEILLGNLLAQVLPEKHFCMQYTFHNNERVDAAVLLGERILPIDSKFPLQGFDGEGASKSSFARNVKNRIDETAKYIRPVEGTFEFAMMYIPAENLYYEIISNGDLFNYAMGKRVIPVSPNSFYAYLQVVVFGLHGMQIEENARLILERISSLGIALKNVQEIYEKLGTSIAGTQNKYSELGKKLGKVANQFEGFSADVLPTDTTIPVIEDGAPLIYSQKSE
jgi:DNA recombination protein RmuC